MGWREWGKGKSRLIRKSLLIGDFVHTISWRTSGGRIITWISPAVPPRRQENLISRRKWRWRAVWIRTWTSRKGINAYLCGCLYRQECLQITLLLPLNRSFATVIHLILFIKLQVSFLLQCWYIWQTGVGHRTSLKCKIIIIFE